MSNQQAFYKWLEIELEVNSIKNLFRNRPQNEEEKTELQIEFSQRCQRLLSKQSDAMKISFDYVRGTEND